MPELTKLWAQYPDVWPAEEKFAAAGLSLSDIGLIEGDLEHLALIAHNVGR